MIWTDKHKSYAFLGRRGSGYSWRSVNHSRREFARTDPDGVRVSTNAVEGLFSPMKKLNRYLHVHKVSKRAYGLYLAEFAWRAG
eukprot:10730077-Karenia_brevis.AAC.1